MFILISFISIYHLYWIPITGVGLLLVTAGNFNFIIKFPVNTQMAINTVISLLFCLFVWVFLRKKGRFPDLIKRRITFQPLSTIICHWNNPQSIMMILKYSQHHIWCTVCTVFVWRSRKCVLWPLWGCVEQVVPGPAPLINWYWFCHLPVMTNDWLAGR